MYYINSDNNDVNLLQFLKVAAKSRDCNLDVYLPEKVRDSLIEQASVLPDVVITGKLSIHFNDIEHCLYLNSTDQNYITVYPVKDLVFSPFKVHAIDKIPCPFCNDDTIENNGEYVCKSCKRHIDPDDPDVFGSVPTSATIKDGIVVTKSYKTDIGIRDSITIHRSSEEEDKESGYK